MNPADRERFLREARAVSNLNHAHICTLHDIGSENGIDYLVMEYIEGPTSPPRGAGQLSGGADLGPRDTVPIRSKGGGMMVLLNGIGVWIYVRGRRLAT